VIDFNQIDTPVNVTDKLILSRVDDNQIFRYYFGLFELGKVYASKFRKDKNPSTGFYISKDGRLIYNDLTTGEKLNCFTFVAKLYGIPYVQALNRIAADFGIVKSDHIKPLAQHILNQTIAFDREAKRNTLIQIIPGSWTSERIAYWQQYEITVDELKAEEVYPVNRLFVNKGEHRSLSHLCFAYVVREKVEGSVRTYLKIYQPHSEKMKWLSNVPITVPFGMYNLKYGTDHVVICKAQKDRLILKKLFESVIGSQNESESALQDGLVKHLCFHFPRRTIIWDADETGVENCKKFNSRGFGYFNTPKDLLEQDIKDVSDYVKAFGLKELEKLLRQRNIL
jgi:hypothetical protein